MKEDSIFIEDEQEEEDKDTYLLKIEDNIERMDREFEAELKNPQVKRAVLAKHHNEVWNSLTDEERTSLKNYTYDYKTSDGHPYFTTMNAILRKGLYEKGKGKDTPFQRGAADDVVEKSKLNYDAVTNCINALKKSKLPQDMIFRRGTSMITLLYMLRLNNSDDPKDWMKQLRKDLDMYNEGTNVIMDRGFFSTASFPNTGLDGEVEWIIQGHAGDEAYFIGEESTFWEEGETLFQAGTRFRLLKICPPGTGGKIYVGDQKTTWKVYLETITDFGPLRGGKKHLE
ncbi:MAG: ADP-ribosyltransferase [Lachnospiraceae bacterium]